MYSAALKDPMPALIQMEELFSLMEEERFRNSGAAPHFGINEQWEPLAASSTSLKYGEGTLVNFGYLRSSAVSPITIMTPYSISMNVDPRKHGAPEDYSGGRNYGYFHQSGDNINGTVREIITITTVFKEQAMRILQNYIGVGKAKVAKIAKTNAAKVEKARSSAVEHISRQEKNKAIRSKGIQAKKIANSQDRSMAELARMKDPSLSTYSHYQNIKLARTASETGTKAAREKATQSSSKLKPEQLDFYKSIEKQHKATGAQKAADGFNTP